MSLKAKIEAVIYAAEEPVTLAQLLGLLGQEGQAELAEIDARQPSLDLPLILDPFPESEAANEFSLIQEGKPLDAAPDEAVPNTPYPVDSALESETAADPELLYAATIDPDVATIDVAATQESGRAEAQTQQAEEQESPNLAPPSGSTHGDDPRQAARERAEERRQAARLRDYFRDLLDTLMAEYAEADRGLEIREVAGGYRLATKPEYHDAVRGFVRSLKPPLKLSLQALETLAVVAYKQPVTAPEVSEIRGVDSGGVLGSLITRKLIIPAGRKQVIGRPILYKTTKEFLLRFGLKDTTELPSIEEFEKMAGELADTEPMQEEMSMLEVNAASTDPPKHGALPPNLASPAGAEPPTQPHASADDILHDDNHVEYPGRGTEPPPMKHGAKADGTPDGKASPTTPSD
jgi:segregation and condensation protein B